MADEFKSNDARLAVTSQGAVIQEQHETKAVLTEGLVPWFRVAGKPAAVVGSSGPNQGEHQQAKQGQKLLPLPTEVTVQTGCDFATLGGKAAALEDSKAQVPDVSTPMKTGFHCEATWFRLNEQPLVRGDA